MHLHGAPFSFSADTELTRGNMKQFLKSHRIGLSKRPIRCHSKTGIIERENHTVKEIFECLQKDTSKYSDATLLSRATFLSNIFSRTSALNSFKLARGYNTALLGVHSRIVPSNFMEAYKDQAGTRALHRLVKSKTLRTIPINLLSPGTENY